MTNNVLRIDASVRSDGSHSRDITDRVIAHIGSESVVTRDLGQGLPLIDNAWVKANTADPDQRSDEQRELLGFSDSLIAELKAADTLVIGFPVYNYGIPAALKAWVDLVSRFGHTFSFGEGGAKGLIEGKRAIVVMASGYTAAGGDGDFASTHLSYVLGFWGITDIQIVAADQSLYNQEAATAKAVEQIKAL